MKPDSVRFQYLSDTSTFRDQGIGLYEIGLGITAFLSVWTTFLSVHLITRHFMNYTRPDFQRPITRILLMVPTYALCALATYMLPVHAVYINVIRDSYEGFVVYNFLTLLLQYLGADSDARQLNLYHKSRRRFPPPLCCFWHEPSHYHFLSFIRVGVIQYVCIRVFTTILSVVLNSVDLLDEESMSLASGHFYITVLNGGSMGLAMFSLFTLYLPIRQDIKQYGPVGQFLSIKFVIFFQFWLNLVIKFVASDDTTKNIDDSFFQQHKSVLIQSTITSIEMAIASLIHLWAFDYRPYVQDTSIRLPDDDDNEPARHLFDDREEPLNENSTSFQRAVAEKLSFPQAVWDSLYWLDLFHDLFFACSFLGTRLTRYFDHCFTSRRNSLLNQPRDSTSVNFGDEDPFLLEEQQPRDSTRSYSPMVPPDVDN